MKMRFSLLALFVILLGMSLPLASAQEDIVDTEPVVEPVTDDDVNAIAKDLYCPVCENIPLDACGTSACEDWRYEIRLQLEAGRTEQQIVDDFVARFGDRVVGTPQDPVLRALSLVTPLLAIALGLFFAVRFFLQYQRDEETTTLATDKQAQDDSTSYKFLLEQDISG